MNWFLGTKCAIRGMAQWIRVLVRATPAKPLQARHWREDGSGLAAVRIAND
jgi:hypothetical protein